MLNADGSANSARMCADDKFMCVQNLNAAVTAGCQTVRFFELLLSHKPSFDSGNISHTLSMQRVPKIFLYHKSPHYS